MKSVDERLDLLERNVEQLFILFKSFQNTQSSLTMDFDNVERQNSKIPNEYQGSIRVDP